MKKKFDANPLYCFQIFNVKLFSSRKNERSRDKNFIFDSTLSFSKNASKLSKSILTFLCIMIDNSKFNFQHTLQQQIGFSQSCTIGSSSFYHCSLFNEKVNIYRNRLISHFENSKIEETEPETKFPSSYIEEENESSRLSQSE